MTTKPSDGRRFRYYTGSDDRSKYLLRMCQGSHLFQLKMAPKMAEQKQMEAQDQKYKEKCIDSYHVVRGLAQARSNSLADDVIGSTTPRRSAASSVSSNTTSGIASEKLQTSLDENDGA